MGNKLTYWEQPEQLAKLRGYMRRGLSLKETAIKIGISEITLKGWIKESSLIRENLRRFASKADLYMIEDRLFSSAKNGEQWAINRYLDAFGGEEYNKELRGEFLPREDNSAFNSILEVIDGSLDIGGRKEDDD